MEGKLKHFSRCLTGNISALYQIFIRSLISGNKSSNLLFYSLFKVRKCLRMFMIFAVLILINLVTFFAFHFYAFLAYQDSAQDIHRKAWLCFLLCRDQDKKAQRGPAQPIKEIFFDLVSLMGNSARRRRLRRLVPK